MSAVGRFAFGGKIENFLLMYIVLSGTHGIGKTTLAAMLAKRLNAVHLTEVIDDVLPPPQLGTDGDPLKAQLWFMRQMILKEAQMADRSKDYVVDRGWADIAAYANVILDDESRQLFHFLFDHVPKRLPDVHIIVHAPLPVVLERIAKRRRDNAANWNEFDREYLQKIISEFERYHRSYKDLRPVYLLDASGSVEENVEVALQYLKPHIARELAVA